MQAEAEYEDAKQVSMRARVESLALISSTSCERGQKGAAAERCRRSSVGESPVGLILAHGSRAHPGLPGCV